MNVFDWLSHMALPSDGYTFDIVEIRFKGGRKDFFRNESRLDLTTGDAVVVEVPNGYHIGYVSLQGELVRLQMLKKNVREKGDHIRKIHRLATEAELDKYAEVANRENPTLYRTREVIQQMKLKMKLSDVEYQADSTKATFYYSAEDRVDFRQLIKSLAGEFRIRVEMRQISLRQEAGRIGGLGVCGRELCCSTWLSEFKSVSTAAARYQNLSLNPTKLSGQCGRLKCCLNYELDTYMEALRDIPTVERPLRTEGGDAFLQKTDIFRKIMWFCYRGETNWYPLPAEQVLEIQQLNRAGQKAPALRLAPVVDEDKELDFLPTAAVDLEMMDQKFRDKNKTKKKRTKKRSGKSKSAVGQEKKPGAPRAKGDQKP